MLLDWLLVRVICICSSEGSVSGKSVARPVFPQTSGYSFEACVACQVIAQFMDMKKLSD